MAAPRIYPKDVAEILGCTVDEYMEMPWQAREVAEAAVQEILEKVCEQLMPQLDRLIVGIQRHQNN